MNMYLKFWCLKQLFIFSLKLRECQEFKNQEISEEDESDKSSDCGSTFSQNLIERLKSSQIAKNERLHRWSKNQESTKVIKDCVVIDKEENNVIINELLSELVLRVCSELNENIYCEKEVKDDRNTTKVDQVENTKQLVDAEYTVFDFGKDFKVIDVENKYEVGSDFDENIHFQIESIDVKNKNKVEKTTEVANVEEKHQMFDFGKGNVMDVKNEHGEKSSASRSPLNASVDAMELNEHLSDMTKVYKRFGKRFSKKNEELNNDIHSRVAMNENEQTKMGSMLTGFMKVGLVSEAEKLFKQWKSNIKFEKNDLKEVKKSLRQKMSPSLNAQK
ncbi:uncharacterized protein LOC136089013 [Hydra vulgaris]|uniref:Uncharacterized protein LOC136089013 n=1 Tax=Hydra vulgaris TaxID=6087 RepID=A0ABM4D885_HYDVU